MKKVLLIIALLISVLGLNAQSVTIDYGTYSLSFETYDVYDDNGNYVETAARLTAYYKMYTTSLTIPSSVTIKGKEFAVTSIGYGTFKGCSSLTSIEIPSSVSEIDGAVFEGCSSLASISFGENSQLTSIGDDAFNGCSSLTSIEIPSSVTTIGEGVFKGCSSLASIEIPSSVSEIGDSAFEGCSSLTSIEIPNSVEFIGWIAFKGCSSLTSIEIPSSVSEIGYGAFSGCSSLTSIEIPSSVSEIGNGVFRGCSSLASIEIPSSVTEIGDSAFEGCSSLTSIEIPNSVEFIGWIAFKGCSSLTSILFGEDTQLKSLYGTFEGCSSLVSIEIPSSVTSLESDYTTEPCGLFGNCLSLTSVTFKEDSQLTFIGQQVFRGCSSLASIKIPSSVSEIGSYVFYDCENLTNVSFCDNSQLTSIGSAFSNCPSLTSIDFGDNSQLTSIGNSTFSNCPSLTSIDFGDNSQLTSIGESAFSDYSSLTSISFGENSKLTSIGWNAFKGCSSLTSIEIPNSVEFIGDEAFKDCSSLTSILFGEDSQLKSLYGGTFEGCSSLVSIEIPSSVTSLDSDYYGIEYSCPFGNCLSLTTVSFKEDSQLTFIGSNVFRGCSALTSIEIPSGVTEIRSGAFLWCSGLTSVTFAEDSKLTYIGGSDEESFGAFEDCSSLTSIEIPSGVITIGEGVFKGCSSLASISVEEGNSVYDSRNNCNAIIETSSNTLMVACQNTIIPNTITTIGANAFEGCSGLTIIEIPDSVDEIWDGAFSNCSNLLSVICYAEYAPKVDHYSYIFGGCPSDMIVYVYKSSLDYYIYSDEWEDLNIKTISTVIDDGGCSLLFEAISPSECSVKCSACPSESVSIKIPSTVMIFEKEYVVTEVETNAFSDCSSLTSIELPNTVTSIGYDAFKGCSSLISIELPNSVISIGDEAFKGCSGLTSIELPNSVESIGYDAFNACSKLTSIELPSRLTSIEDGVFSGCSSLTNIEIPENVAYIGDGAFAECFGLKNIIIPRNVIYIGDEAFTACMKLESITIYAEKVPYTYSTALSSCPSDMIIYVPEVSFDAYKASYPWYLYDIVPIDGIGKSFMVESEDYTLKFVITSVEPAKCKVVCYDNPTSPTTVVIPETISLNRKKYSVTSIDDYAFVNCTNITSIIIPNTVVSVGNNAFSGCTNLMKVICFAESVPVTGSDVFEDCPSDMTIYVHDIALNQYDLYSPWNEYEIVSLKPKLTVNKENTSSVVLEWEECGAKYYEIYRNNKFVTTVTETVFTDTDLESDSGYCYIVKAVYDGDYSVMSDEVCIGAVEYIEELSLSFNIYPNPVNDKIYIETEVEIEDVVVYDVYGRQQSTVNGQQTSSIDVSNLNSGVYFIKIKSNDKFVLKRFVKK